MCHPGPAASADARRGHGCRGGRGCSSSRVSAGASSAPRRPGCHPLGSSMRTPTFQRSPCQVLDVASASGEPAASLAAALPRARVVATDLAAPFVELGRRRAARLGLRNLTFEAADAERLAQFAGASFDAVTCSLSLM